VDGKIKSMKKSLIIFLFADSPVLHFTITGLFASKAKKKSRIA